MSETESQEPTFLDGYLSACQNLVFAGHEDLAESLLSEGGFRQDDLLASQHSSGFMTLRMNEVIRKATDNG